MTQFKETEAFEDLQRIVGHEIAGIFLARLKEFDVPEDRLRQLSEDICYDIASAMNTISDFEIPTEEIPVAVEANKPEEQQLVEPDEIDPVLLEEKTDRFELPDLTPDGLTFMEEIPSEPYVSESSMNDASYDVDKTADYEMTDRHKANKAINKVEGVLSQDEILKILNAAKVTSA